MNDLNAAQKMFPISHASDVAAARRFGAQLAEAHGFNETVAGKLAIVITEAATNILKHAGNGMVFLTPVREKEAKGIEVLALDRGPGIANIGHSLRDGISTAGTAGTGLGAMGRQSDEFDLYSLPGNGAAFYMCIWDAPQHATKPALQLGAVCVPMAGEEECGDAWTSADTASGITLMVADGLGHGPAAATASGAAVKAVQARPESKPGLMIETIHQALRPTRGAAVAVMRVQPQLQQIEFAGVGNINACILDGATRKQLVSHNGIVGHNMRKVQEFVLPLPKGAICVMCSDGITTQWDLSKYPGLLARHPALIAGIIYRDFVRGRDDATVVALRAS